jgi:hypothetical protein
MCARYNNSHFASNAVSSRRRRPPQVQPKVKEHEHHLGELRAAIAGKLRERNEEMTKPSLLKYAIEKAQERGIHLHRLCRRHMDYCICWLYENFPDIMDLTDQDIDGEWEPYWGDNVDDWFDEWRSS